MTDEQLTDEPVEHRYALRGRHGLVFLALALVLGPILAIGVLCLVALVMGGGELVPLVLNRLLPIMLYGGGPMLLLTAIVLGTLLLGGRDVGFWFFAFWVFLPAWLFQPVGMFVDAMTGCALSMNRGPFCWQGVANIRPSDIIAGLPHTIPFGIVAGGILWQLGKMAGLVRVYPKQPIYLE